MGAGVGAGPGTGRGDGVGGAAVAAGVVTGAGVLSELIAHEDPVGTGHDSKHGLTSTTDPSSNVTTKPAVPSAPSGDALHVAPLTRVIEKLLLPTLILALMTAPGRFEKMTLV